MKRPSRAALFLAIASTFASPAPAQTPNLPPPPTPLAGCLAAIGVAWAKNTLDTPDARQTIQDACKNVSKRELLMTGLLSAMILDLVLSAGPHHSHHHGEGQDMPFD